MFLRSLTVAASSMALSSCLHAPHPTNADKFFMSIFPYCGNAYEGKLVSNDEVDSNFAAETIVMHVRDCTKNQIRIPLHVGENRSRTWIITDTGPSLRLKHDHRHEDGEEDAITMYGGDAPLKQSTRNMFSFPADDFSKTMFDKEGIPDSKQNTWVVELNPDANLFAYQMSRPNRFFRLQFDLSRPVETPPPAWGHE